LPPRKEEGNQERKDELSKEEIDIKKPPLRGEAEITFGSPGKRGIGQKRRLNERAGTVTHTGEKGSDGKKENLCALKSGGTSVEKGTSVHRGSSGGGEDGARKSLNGEKGEMKKSIDLETGRHRKI